MGRYTSLSVGLLVTASIGCSESTAGSKFGSPDSGQSFQSAGLYAQFIAVSATDRSAWFEQVGAMSIPDFYDFLTAHASDAPAEIDAAVQAQTKRKLTENRPEILGMTAAYSSVRALWRATGFDPSSLDRAAFTKSWQPAQLELAGSLTGSASCDQHVNDLSDTFGISSATLLGMVHSVAGPASTTSPRIVIGSGETHMTKILMSNNGDTATLEQLGTITVPYPDSIVETQPKCWSLMQSAAEAATKASKAGATAKPLAFEIDSSAVE